MPLRNFCVCVCVMAENRMSLLIKRHMRTTHLATDPNLDGPVLFVGAPGYDDNPAIAARKMNLGAVVRCNHSASKGGIRRQPAQGIGLAQREIDSSNDKRLHSQLPCDRTSTTRPTRGSYTLAIPSSPPVTANPFTDETATMRGYIRSLGSRTLCLGFEVGGNEYISIASRRLVTKRSPSLCNAAWPLYTIR